MQRNVLRQLSEFAELRDFFCNHTYWIESYAILDFVG